MIDRDRIERFWEQRAAIDEPRLSSHFRHDDSHVFDAELVLREMRTGGSLLDLGSGPGTLTGILLPQVRRLVAVDFRGEFFRFLPDDPKIETIVADVVTFETAETFDNILMFGLVNYLSPDQAEITYEKVARMLRPAGVFIVKHQTGNDGEVVVDAYSEQIGCSYHARYPARAAELLALRRHFDSVEMVDIYPQRLNPWPNTHFFAFVCREPRCMQTA